MDEKQLNIGEQINTMCKHDKNQLKPIESMQICMRGMEYIRTLVENGEMGAIQCEPCTIEWLCGEPLESCMNPEDTIQWYTKCTRPAGFWVIHIEAMLNSEEQRKFMQNDQFPVDLLQSMMNCIIMHEIDVQLVAPGI